MRRSAAEMGPVCLVGWVFCLLAVGAVLPIPAAATEAATGPSIQTPTHPTTQASAEPAPGVPHPQPAAEYGLARAAQPAASWGPRQPAWADGVSTALALSNGAFERNPLIGASPASLLAVTGAKLGIVEWVERSQLEPQQRQRTLKALSAMWGGASINNLFVLLSAQPAVALLAGLAGGLWLWRAEDAALESSPVQSAQASPPNTSRE